MILIDDQGGEKSSFSLIKHLPAELVQRRRQLSADASFLGHGPDGLFTFPVGVEYKKIEEAISSFISKRFVGEQYPKMTQHYRRIYFILEGEYKEGSDGILVVPSWSGGKLHWVSHGWSVSYRAFDNWQNSLTETGKVIFKRSRDVQESASQLLDLYYMWTKEYDEHKSLFAFDKSQIPPTLLPPSLTRLMAAQIPHIGWKRSAEVDKAFSSPYDMVTAEESKWNEITGIGKVIAKRVVACLRNQLMKPT